MSIVGTAMRNTRTAERYPGHQTTIRDRHVRASSTRRPRRAERQLQDALATDELLGDGQTRHPVALTRYPIRPDLEQKGQGVGRQDSKRHDWVRRSLRGDGMPKIVITH